MNQSPSILTDVFERITDAFVALDTNWCYTYMNKKAGEIFQRNPVDMIGKHIWTEFPEGIDQSFYKAYYKAMAEQQYIHVEEYYSPYDKWFENHIYPSPDGLSIFFRDITEQKKHTRELELRDKHFQALLENNPSIIVLTDDTLNPIYKSPSSTLITGWTDEDMKITGDINRVHPDDIITMNTTVAEAIKNPGIPQPYISRYLHKNGHYIWLDGTATKLPDDSVVKGIVFNARDVTEKMELEQLLLKANKLARIGSWNVDLIKQTVYWNDITREIHEADKSFVPDLATGINFYKEGASRELITQKVKEAIELGKPFDEELEIVTVKNNERWIRTIGETEMVDGKCVKIYGSFQDIDRRKRAEEKVIESGNRYRRLFDTSPIAITEEDHTAFYEKIESLRASGISKNYATYFHNHGEELYEMLGRVQILGVNQSLLDLTGAHNLDDFVANRSEFFISMTEMTVFKLMELIRDGGGDFEEVTKIKSLSGKIKEVVVRLKYPAAPPYNSVAITMLDVTKQKESEQKITESEELFRTFSDNIQNLAWIADKDGWIYWYNQRWYDYTGTNFDEMQGWGWEKVHHPDHLKSVVDFLKEAWHKPEPWELIFPLKCADSEYHWFLTRCEPILDAQGKIVRWIGTNTDIHEQKVAQEKIKASEEKFRALVENNDSIIGMFDEHLNPIYRSPSTYRILGWTMEENANDEQLNHIHPDDRELFKNTWKELMTNPGKAFKKSLRLKHKNGNWVMLEGTITNLLHNSAVRAIVSNIQDITERKKAEQAVKESEEKFRALVTASSDSIYRMNPDWTVMNELDGRGFIPDSVKPNSNWFQEYIHPNDQPLVMAAIKEAIRTKSVFELEHPVLQVDGTLGWTFSRAVPLFDAKDNIVEWFGAASNITKRKKVQEEILQSQKRLNEAQTISHIGNWEIDFVDNTHIWSDEFYNILGVAQKDMQPSPEGFLSSIHPDDFSRVKDLIERTFVTFESSSFNARVFTPNGNTKDVYSQWQFEFDKNQKPLRLYGVLQDITERKKAEEKIRLSEVRLLKAQEIGKFGYWHQDIYSDKVWASKEAMRIYGFGTEEGELQRATIAACIIDVDMVREAAVNLVEHGKEYNIDIRINPADGSPMKYISALAELEKNEKGEPTRIVGTLQDITERKIAQKELKENENFLRTILDTEPECVKILNSKGELLSMNPAGLAMIEADNEQQVLGHRMTELVDKKYRLGFNRLSNDVFNGNSGTFEFEVTGLKGGHRWLETHAVPLKDAAGKVENLLGVTRDITQRKKAEEEILNTTKELRKLTAHLQTIREEERKRIAREIHDELGQQLTAIKMDTVWIDKQVPSESVSIKNKLQNMIELLDGSHQSIRKILNELRPAALDDKSLLETLEWLGKQFTETSATPVHFTSNQSSIKLQEETAICIFRVYQEALTNVIRYANASKVESSLNIIGKSILLTIEDDGKGFDTSAVQSKDSFGLLGIKERVHSLNGAFDLISLPDKGTKLIINLPYTNVLPE